MEKGFLRYLVVTSRIFSVLDSRPKQPRNTEGFNGSVS